MDRNAIQVRFLIIAIYCAVLIGACQAKPVTPTIKPTSTMESPTATAAPTNSPPPQPTITATSTPYPTPTPFPTDYLNAFLPEHAVVRFGKGPLSWGSMKLSPDGRLLMVTNTIGTTIYDAETFEEIWSIQSQQGRGFSSDSEFVLTTDRQGSTIYEAGSGRIVEQTTGDSRSFSIIWLPDGSLYQYSVDCNSNITYISRVRNENEVFTVEGCTLDCIGNIGIRGCNPYNPLLALGTEGTVSIVDVRTGEKLWKKKPRTGRRN